MNKRDIIIESNDWATIENYYGKGKDKAIEKGLAVTLEDYEAAEEVKATMKDMDVEIKVQYYYSTPTDKALTISFELDRGHLIIKNGKIKVRRVIGAASSTDWDLKQIIESMTIREVEQ